MNKALLKLKAILFGRFFRDNNLVAVISSHNTFTGNCKYAAMEIQKRFPEKRIIWFVHNEQQQKEIEKQAGVETGIRLSNYYNNILSKAKYIISDNDFMGFFLANGAMQIDFWHGTPIKKIRYDQFDKKPSFRRKFMWWLNRKNWIQSGTSESDVKILCDAGRLPHYMGRVFGTPCIAPLVDKNILKGEINKDKKLKSLQSQIKKYSKVFLYVPTFRDSGADFLKDLKFNAEKLNDICKSKNILFLIKLHPVCNFDLNKQYNNIKTLDKFYDGTVCIGLSDVVVSDYSSMFHNALAGNKKIILMHGDMDEYRNNNRDIYDWALNDMQGHIINDFNDLCELIEKDKKIKRVPQKIIDKYWDKKILKNPYKFMEIIK